jgi:hypothetical protein
MAGFIGSFKDSLRTLIGLQRHDLVVLRDPEAGRPATLLQSNELLVSKQPLLPVAAAQASKPAEAVETTMSVETTLETIGSDVASFWNKLKSDVTKAKAVWSIISSQQTRAAMIAVFNAAVKAVQDGAAAAAAGGTNVVLDDVVVTDIEALIAAVKAGDGVVIADFKAIGIALK